MLLDPMNSDYFDYNRVTLRAVRFLDCDLGLNPTHRAYSCLNRFLTMGFVSSGVEQ